MSLPASLSSFPPISGVRTVSGSGVFRRGPTLPDPVRLAAEGAAELGARVGAVLVYADGPRPGRACLLDVERGHARESRELFDDLAQVRAELDGPRLLRATPLARALLGARELVAIPIVTPAADLGFFVAGTRPGWQQALPTLRSLAAEFALDWELADRKVRLSELRLLG